MTIQKTMRQTIIEFTEGMVEIFVLSVVFVLEKAFTSINLPGANWDTLLNFLAIVFVGSLIFNLIKGIFIPFFAAVNVIGMLVGLFLSYTVIWQITPNAIIELISYIIAATVGIYLGVKIRGAGKDQEQTYYRF